MAKSHNKGSADLSCKLLEAADAGGCAGGGSVALGRPQSAVDLELGDQERAQPCCS